MAELAKEVPSAPDSSATAVANDVVVDKDKSTPSVTTKFEKANGTTDGDGSNGAKPAESGQATSESGVKLRNGDDTKSLDDSKGTLSGQTDRTINQYSKRENKSKFDPSSKTVPEDAAARAQLIRNQVCCSEAIT
jgi:hypothetical protein